MRLLLLCVTLAATPALADEPEAPEPATDVSSSEAPLTGQIRFHIEGMKPVGDGF